MNRSVWCGGYVSKGCRCVWWLCELGCVCGGYVSEGVCVVGM